MQFLRKYELRFGTPIQITKDWFSPVKPSSEKLIDFSSFPDTFLIRDHHIEFTIQHITGTGQRSNSITIYNLSQEVVDNIKDNVDGKMPVELKAGYADGIKLIFKGTIESFTDENHTETRKTTLNLADGSINIKEAVSSRAYSKGTPTSQMLSDILSDLGLPKAEGTSIAFSEGDTVRSQIYVTGKTADNLWALGKDYNFDFTVVNGSAYVVPKGKSAGTLSPLVSYSTGLVGSISPNVDNSGKTSEATKTRQIKFTCLLNGEFIPTCRCKVEDDMYGGTYKVIEVTHKGSYEGGEWTTDVIAELLEQ